MKTLANVKEAPSQNQARQPDRRATYGGEYSWLISSKIITVDQFDSSVIEAKETDVSIEHILMERYAVRMDEIGLSISRYYSIPYCKFEPESFVRPVDLIKKLKRDLLLKSGWLPIEDFGGQVKIVTTDPEFVKSSRHGAITPGAVFGKSIIWMVTTGTEFKSFMDWLFEPKTTDEPQAGLIDDGSTIDDIVANLSPGDDEDALVDPEVDPAEESEIVKLVNRVLLEAYHKKVSDIHIEPIFRGKVTNSVVRVRYRTDGVLKKYTDIPFKYRSAVLSRLKIVAGLDIAEKRRPQDGKFKMQLSDSSSFEMRIATIPSQAGMEDAVIRILASGAKPMPLNKAGLSHKNEQMIRQSIERPYGLFFVCGPTGSGKTTTLHSILAHLNIEDTKIWTAEDPVEIVQEGLRQVQINKKAGLDFAAIMRSFLRADPDIIMVGEMRDKETVSVGIEASLTGHLVLSTLHTNSAPESIIRLLDMGMDPFNFADALLGILAQRLARTLCVDCKEAYEPGHDEIIAMLNEYCEELKCLPQFQSNYAEAAKITYASWVKDFGKDGKLSLNRAKPGGCIKCNGSGYRGRAGLHEFLMANDEVKAAIQQRKRPAEISVVAFNTANFRTLKQDGVEKVLKGIIDMKEVRKVCIK